METDELMVRYLVHHAGDIGKLNECLENVPLSITPLLDDLHEIVVSLDDAGNYGLVIYLDSIGNQRQAPEVAEMYEDHNAQTKWANSRKHLREPGTWHEEVNRRIIVDKIIKPDEGFIVTYTLDNFIQNLPKPGASRSESMHISSSEGYGFVEVDYLNKGNPMQIRLSMLPEEIL